jgi:hypothetical protein
MTDRCYFILESGGLEFHVIRYQPDNTENSMTSTTDKPAAPKGIPAMERVKSSSIAEIGHDGQHLFARYAAGSLYRFKDITVEQYNTLRASKSIGAHMNTYIIPKAKGVLVREE